MPRFRGEQKFSSLPFTTRNEKSSANSYVKRGHLWYLVFLEAWWICFASDAPHNTVFQATKGSFFSFKEGFLLATSMSVQWCPAYGGSVIKNTVRSRLVVRDLSIVRQNDLPLLAHHSHYYFYVDIMIMVVLQRSHNPWLGRDNYIELTFSLSYPPLSRSFWNIVISGFWSS